MLPGTLDADARGENHGGADAEQLAIFHVATSVRMSGLMTGGTGVAAQFAIAAHLLVRQQRGCGKMIPQMRGTQPSLDFTAALRPPR